ncbi:pyridine nucleotide-disulfide oxidoreductase-domain-containing protein [Echria macrotheca]|uniref:Pyridine nucleotide-disulfide oxidoreductase-domain-containing protein n=1 Tax=Echria macrotheca TaxID=438768 RepID=A0AAJ0BH52_9PEZI|nr:pyridine nucleotide-disulfide oxidoreductase-domain-containing protein [Echria macrotheca]
MHPIPTRARGIAALAHRINLTRWRNSHQFFFCASVSARNYHGSRDNTAAVVVGAGPAGIAVVGNLLEHLPADAGKITWIDPEFNAGRIRNYGQVPSNTKIGLFLEYARALEPFREIYEKSPKQNAIRVLEAMPKDETCSLGYAGDMLRQLTQGLAAHERINKVTAHVVTSERQSDASNWELQLQPPRKTEAETLGSVTSPMVVYCTGSFPTKMQLHPDLTKNGVEQVHLDTALNPPLLAKELVRRQDQDITRVGVIGASHSAVLVLMNLVKLAQTSRPDIRVDWFARSPHFKYAEQKDGWILYDNTGLKGTAAVFARTELDGNKLLTSEAGKIITRIDCSGGLEKEAATIRSRGLGCQYIIPAIGFTPRPIPGFASNNKPLFNHRTGAFEDHAGGLIKGLYGAGIAFPEQVTDPAGHTEYAVGFWKFMRFLRRVVPEWVAKEAR